MYSSKSAKHKVGFISYTRKSLFITLISICSSASSSSLSSSSSSFTSQALIDLFHICLIVSSKAFQVVFFHLVYNSALFLASCCFQSFTRLSQCAVLLQFCNFSPSLRNLCLYQDVNCCYCWCKMHAYLQPNAWKVLKCGAGEGWRRSVAPIV